MRVGSREEGVRQGSRHSGDRGGTRGTALPRSPGKGRKSVKALGAGGVGTPYWGGGGANTENSSRSFHSPTPPYPHRQRHTPILQVVCLRSGARLEPRCSAGFAETGHQGKGRHPDRHLGRVWKGAEEDLQEGAPTRTPSTA